MKVPKLAVFSTSNLPVPAGRVLVTYAGTVNCNALASAMQLKLAVAPVAMLDELPSIDTYEFGAPPVQVTLTPDPRLTVAASL